MLTLEEIKTANWPRITDLVESILLGRMVKKKKGTHVIERHATFRDFAQEINEDQAAAYRWIRGGVTPLPRNQSRVRTWCRKHYDHVL